MAAEFDIARIEELRQCLLDAPDPTSTTVRRSEAIRMLAPQIAQMQAKGYSLVKIAAFLTDKGLAVSAGGIKASLRGTGTSKSRRGAARKSGARAGSSRRASAATVAPPVENNGTVAGQTPATTEPATTATATGSSVNANAGSRKRNGAPAVEVGDGHDRTAPSLPTGSHGNHATGTTAVPKKAPTEGSAVPSWSFRPREDTDDL